MLTRTNTANPKYIVVAPEIANTHLAASKLVLKVIPIMKPK
jgi:hypothetical protein